MTRMRLDEFANGNFDRGRPAVTEMAWMIVHAGLFGSWIPGSAWRCWLLRLFGARIGRAVVIKPRVRIKFPWRLAIGDHSWIGESAWIDNLGQVTIGNHVCLSQGSYLCTGSHDWHARAFTLIVRPITLCDHAWVGAMAQLCPGARLADGSVLTMGSRLSGDTAPDEIYDGIPARSIGKRERPTSS